MFVVFSIVFIAFKPRIDRRNVDERRSVGRGEADRRGKADNKYIEKRTLVIIIIMIISIIILLIINLVACSLN